MYIMQGNDDPLIGLIQDDIQNTCTKEESAINLEKCCIRLIHEFLLSYELDITAEAFIKECVVQGFPVPEPPVIRKDRIKRENVHKILEHFTRKDLLKFFDTWVSLVPVSIQQKLEYKKLTFYLHVHFAVLPLRGQEESASSGISNNCGDESAENEQEKQLDSVAEEDSKPNIETVQKSRYMEVLRQFLETKGTEFSAEPEFLPFYALPFVNDPTTHPSFRELFMEQWMVCLANSLRQFVEEHSWGSTVSPQLMQICNVQQQSNRKSHSHSIEGHSSYKLLKRRYHKLHKDHHNLLSVAAELTSALENSVKGHPVDLEETLCNCSKIFPELFNSTHQTNGESENQEDSLSPSGPFELDFKKIKHHLATGSVKTKLLLFQALRWRITRSGLDERDGVVSAFLRHDVLSLHRAGALASHFSPTNVATPHPLQQAAARLVNTLASLRSGRDYLCSVNCGLLIVLVGCLKGDRGVSIDTITSDMILATLQKLSLRHNQRVWMLEAGLVEWLVHHLSNEGASMKTYALEYSTALLMNLCLHRRAKERCVPLAKTVLKVLTDLLSTELTQAVPYVNGTLYSLLANSQINFEAKRMGLSNILEYYLKHSSGEMHKQLEYILKLHRGDCQPDHSATSEEENADDDTEEVDLLEEELDAEDPVRIIHGDLNGEELLYQQYRLVFPYHGVVHPSSSSAQQGELLVRPTTPRHRSSNSPMLTASGSGSVMSQSTSIASSENHFVSLSSTLEQVQETTETEVHIEILEESIEQQNDSIILENLESEVEKDDDVVCHTPRSLTEGQLSVEDIPGQQTGHDETRLGNCLTQSSRPASAVEDGNEDEFIQAFRSRPRITRTPTPLNTSPTW